MVKIGTKMRTQSVLPWRKASLWATATTRRLPTNGCRSCGTRRLDGRRCCAGAVPRLGHHHASAIPGTTDPQAMFEAGRPTTCRPTAAPLGVAVVRPGAAVFRRDLQEPPVHPAFGPGP